MSGVGYCASTTRCVVGVLYMVVCTSDTIMLATYNNHTQQRTRLVIDVCVPSYRVQYKALQRIVGCPWDRMVADVRFLVQIDNPKHNPAQLAQLADLRASMGHRYVCLVLWGLFVFLLCDGVDITECPHSIPTPSHPVPHPIPNTGSHCA